MPEPTEFLVVQNLRDALQGITVADGYHYDLAALAVKLDPNHGVEQLLGDEKKRPFAVIELTPDAFEYSPSLMVTVRMPMTIHLVHEANLEDDDNWLRTYLRLCADGERAIATDIQRGGRAIDTRILSREFESYGGSQVWAQLHVVAMVRRAYGSPDG